MATEIRTFSMVGPHSGTNLSDLAKIVPGTFMVILILLVKKTQFFTEKAFYVKKFFLRSGYMLKDTVAFSQHIENMMRETLGVDKDESVEEEEELPEVEEPETEADDEDGEEEVEDDATEEDHDEL